jgi:hypothetical protein
MMKRPHWGIALLVLASAPEARAQDKPSSKDLKALFEKAEELELYSLDPAPDIKDQDAKTGFHGWKILGKTTIKEAKTRKKVIEALYKGLAESDGTVAKCFIPRHGIRAAAGGKTADVVICFECLQTQFHVGAASSTEATTRSPEKVLDEVLTAAGVPLAPKKK